ncbi:MAG: hypothetical protein FJ308_05010 [Planctomycetes bacterium]|nr:hypothetical protein [Planctomycetota bacterium]
MKRMLWMTVLAATVSQVGCGSKDPSTVAGTPTTAAGTAPAATASLPGSSGVGGAGANLAASGGTAAQMAPPAAVTVPLNTLNLGNPKKPEEIVASFLDGMRSGNAKVIESLLSTRARQEIAAKGLDIAPIGSPQAQFEIEKAEFPDPKDPTIVLVTSNWLEPALGAQEATEYEVVWALVQEPEGWRICEMAVDTHIEGEEIQVVNFENLADVVQQTEAPRTAALPNGAPSAPAAVPSAALPSAALPSAALPSAALPSAALPGAALPGAAGVPALPPGGSVPGAVAPTGLPPAGLAPGLPPAGLPQGSGSLPPASGVGSLRSPGPAVPGSAPGALPPGSLPYLPPVGGSLPASGGPSLR